jgi:hypothetical protein
MWSTVGTEVVRWNSLEGLEQRRLISLAAFVLANITPVQNDIWELLNYVESAGLKHVGREGDEAGRVLHAAFGHREGTEALHRAFQEQELAILCRDCEEPNEPAAEAVAETNSQEERTNE